jgi:ATP-dependent RNA/DNA helicase IGHMBP2
MATPRQAPLPEAVAEDLARLRRLLDLERAEEVRRVDTILAGHRLAALVELGMAAPGLSTEEAGSGLGGRYLVRFVSGTGALPAACAIGVGDLVRVVHKEATESGAPVGLVAERRPGSLMVAFEAPLADAFTGAGLALVQVANDVTFRRMEGGLQAAARLPRGRAAALRDLLLDDGAPAPAFVETAPATVAWQNGDLDDSQCAAVMRILAARDVALLHGPPGTGKTTTLVEAIRQARVRGGRVLVAAASNAAVDNLVEPLPAAPEAVVRIGHPGRVAEPLRAHTLDLLVREEESWRISRDVLAEVRALMQQRGRLESRLDRGRTDPRALRDEKRGVQREIGRLMGELRRLERQAVARVLDRARIVCATHTGCASDVLSGERFDWVVVDEATQATEPATLLPVLRAGDDARLVLAGDHHQLPPTVTSLEAAREGLARSLFERLVQRWGDAARVMLTVQYRMHAAIMAFPAERFYEGRLTAAPAVAGHLLRDLPGVSSGPETGTPLEVIDTAGRGFEEVREPGSESCKNPEEADLVAERVRALLEAGVPPESVAVITPYAGQVQALRDRLSDLPQVEVGTVDGFQGREKEAVFVSLVRANAEAQVGFLADVRRMNVAWTRARRRLVVVGDGATLSAHPFYRAMLDHAEAAGAYRSAWELV